MNGSKKPTQVSRNIIDNESNVAESRAINCSLRAFAQDVVVEDLECRPLRAVAR